MSPRVQRAHKFVDAGIGLLPIRADGTKRPALPEWAFLQDRLPTPDELVAWFDEPTDPIGMAAICGRVSGNLEAVDIDAPDLVQAWRTGVERLRSGLLDRLVHVETPTGGAHYWYRHRDVPMGNKKLAQESRTDDNGRERPYTLIETRGQGGYALLPGSALACHPTGCPYQLTHGSFGALPVLDIGERLCLIDAARALGTWEPSVQDTRTMRVHEPDGDRPGDRFNAENDWRRILEPHGWRVERSRGEELFWRRPGKDEGLSATTGYGAADVLYVFSTNAHPFESEKSYSKFAAYTLLEHDGDYTAAAHALKTGEKP